MEFRQGRGPLGGEDGPEPRPGALCRGRPGGVEAGGQDFGAQSSREEEARTVGKAAVLPGEPPQGPLGVPPS